MRRDFWSLVVPLVADHLGASAKTAGRADFLLGMERDLPAAPAGDVGELVHLSHGWSAF
jgi:hypothetical protein